MNKFLYDDNGPGRGLDRWTEKHKHEYPDTRTRLGLLLSKIEAV